MNILVPFNASVSNVNTAATRINENFDDCTQNRGFLKKSCPSQECDYRCFVPDELNDHQKETIHENSEDSLQEILDDRGYSIDVEDDQTNIQAWHTSNFVTLEITYLGGVAGAKHAFGYYLNGDRNTFVALFEDGNHPLYSLPVASVGDSFTITIPNNETAGFAIDTWLNGSSHLQFSENSLNDNSRDRVIVFDLCDEFLLGFEDLTDLDYQDVVVSVHRLSCNAESVCGNGTLEAGEQCDLGGQNGQTCTPDYNATCQWCSTECETQQEQAHIAETKYKTDQKNAMEQTE